MQKNKNNQHLGHDRAHKVSVTVNMEHNVFFQRGPKACLKVVGLNYCKQKVLPYLAMLSLQSKKMKIAMLGRQ